MFLQDALKVAGKHNSVTNKATWVW